MTEEERKKKEASDFLATVKAAISEQKAEKGSTYLSPPDDIAAKMGQNAPTGPSAEGASLLQGYLAKAHPDIAQGLQQKQAMADQAAQSSPDAVDPMGTPTNLPPGTIEAGIRGAGRFASMGTGPAIEAGMKSLPVIGNGQDYRTNLDAINTRSDQLRKDHPTADTIGSGIGMATTGLATGGLGPEAEGAGILGKAAAGALTNYGQGAVQAGGEALSRGEGVPGIAKAASGGGNVGAAIGAAVPLVANSMGAAYGGIKNYVAGAAKRAEGHTAELLGQQAGKTERANIGLNVDDGDRVTESLIHDEPALQKAARSKNPGPAVRSELDAIAYRANQKLDQLYDQGQNFSASKPVQTVNDADIMSSTPVVPKGSVNFPDRYTGNKASANDNLMGNDTGGIPTTPADTTETSVMSKPNFTPDHRNLLGQPEAGYVPFGGKPTATSEDATKALPTEPAPAPAPGGSKVRLGDAIDRMDASINSMKKGTVGEAAVADKLAAIRDQMIAHHGNDMEKMVPLRLMRKEQSERQALGYGKVDPAHPDAAESVSNIAANMQASKDIGEAVTQHVTGLPYAQAKQEAEMNPTSFAGQLMSANDQLSAVNKIRAAIDSKAGKTSEEAYNHLGQGLPMRHVGFGAAALGSLVKNGARWVGEAGLAGGLAHTGHAALAGIGSAALVADAAISTVPKIAPALDPALASLKWKPYNGAVAQNAKRMLLSGVSAATTDAYIKKTSPASSTLKKPLEDYVGGGDPTQFNKALQDHIFDDNQ